MATCKVFASVRKPSPLESMTKRYPIVMESKHAHALPEMVLEHGVAHLRIDTTERLCNNRVAGEDV